MEQLLHECNLTEQQTRIFEQKSCDAIYISMKKLKDAAVKARGDLEEEYRLLLKAGELANIIRRSPRLASWDLGTKTLFHADYGKVVDQASNLQAVLQKKYESLQIRRDQLDRAASIEAEKKSETTAAFRAHRPLITPRELVRRVENDDPKKSAIIFDIRQNQADAIFYSRSEMITVIQVPYDILNSSLTFNDLRNNLSVNQRALLPRISGCDYIVLMDDDSPELANGSPKPGTKASALFKALLTLSYTSSDIRPRERPLFMEGGFRMWKMHWPTYTKKEQPLSARSTPSDSVDDAISKYAANYTDLSHITYPDLTALPPGSREPPVRVAQQPAIPPRPPMFPQEPEVPLPRPGFGVYTPNIPQRPTLPPTSERPGAPIFSPNPTTVVPPPPPVSTQKPSPEVPIFPDRTSKPSMGPPERPTIRFRKKDPSPTRQNGGGEVKRPPLLDRSSKPATHQMSKEYEVQLLSIYEQMQMQIRRMSRESSTPNPGATGLFNMGNTCFMSATLQCLFQTPGLPEVFSKRTFASKVNTESRMGSKGIISAGFAALMDSIWEGKMEAIKPSRFLQLFADTVSSVLSDGRQHDASEFQIFLLDALHEDTNMARRISFEQNYRGGANIKREATDFIEKQRQFSNSPVNQIFGGLSVSEIRCQTCGESSATFEESTIISVELTSTRECTLDSCLKSHFSETVLDGDSRWNCPKCKTPRASTRRSKLWSLPKVLVIHLKRFALFNGDFEKNSAAVTFDPQRFDVRPYLHESAAPDRPYYKLYATTIHNGRLNSGHYTSVAAHLRADRWLRFDDESVRPISSFSVDPSLAYILWYKRC
ncbi:unnamed protein product [Caenorhabditis sp. 36 PRJEB53466]|nr:unnamed protein product [Caenorhabditis sp. 36 PRJEB53466]